uniref:Uncharacterized protein n=1 Tax=Romanomermis culicivorax TaxID=13658 RepID=A0A915KP02_ROMCU
MKSGFDFTYANVDRRCAQVQFGLRKADHFEAFYCSLDSLDEYVFAYASGTFHSVGYGDIFTE